MGSWLPDSGLAQEDTWSGGLIYPQSMWMEDYRPSPYTTESEIRERVNRPSKSRRFSPIISIPAKTFNNVYDLFEQNKSSVFSLRILGATNDDIQLLSKLDSLVRLALPVCKADNFRALIKLDNLEELRVASPNIDQFREERLLAQMASLSDLTLYNVEDLQAALELPGLEPCLSLEAPQAKGIVTFTVHAPAWNPRQKIQWPEKLQELPNFCVLGDRIRIGYCRGQRAVIIIGRHSRDDPSICSRLLKNLFEKSGFYDHQQVTRVDLTSRFEQRAEGGYQSIVIHDKTDISALRAFPELRYLNLEGDFYGFKSLRDAPLESIYYVMDSPAPSDQTVEVLSKHPTLRSVRKNIESATDEVIWER